MILYIVPNINKVSGGPRSRISNYKKEFLSSGNSVIEGYWLAKLKGAFRSEVKAKIYIETASNRLFFIDFICLSIIYMKKGKIIPFIRDIYIELLPEEYVSVRGRITKYLNKISNRFLCKISYKVLFPTIEMAKVYFIKNKFSRVIEYDALPPGTTKIENEISFEGTNTDRIGIAFLGGINYTNSGILNFLNLAKDFKNQYNFFILSQDSNVAELLVLHGLIDEVTHTHINFNLLSDFFSEQNIKFAVHSRDRSTYDDLTFPIKILDLISLNIPFFTEKHKPIVNLIGEDYPLFCGMSDYDKFKLLLADYAQKENYQALVNKLKNLAERNLYKSRFSDLKKIFESNCSPSKY